MISFAMFEPVSPIWALLTGGVLGSLYAALAEKRNPELAVVVSVVFLVLGLVCFVIGGLHDGRAWFMLSLSIPIQIKIFGHAKP